MSRDILTAHAHSAIKLISVNLWCRESNGMKYLCRLVPRLLVIITIAVVFAVFGGCSQESEDSDATNRFRELLKLVPSSVDLSQAPLVLADYASCYEDNDISLTGADGRPLTFQEFIDFQIQNEIGYIPMHGYSFITGYGPHATEGTIKDEYVGYNFTDVDAEILTGAPPLSLTAAIGRFDPQATRDALSRQDEWPSWAVDAYTVEEYNGVTIHSWGDGYQIRPMDRLVPPHIDTLGRARPLAVTEKYLFSVATTEILKSMIDASQGKAESLADLPEFAEVANALSKFDVYGIAIGTEATSYSHPLLMEACPGPPLKKYLSYGEGRVMDENGIYSILVLYHESADDAEANMSLLEQRIDSIASQSDYIFGIGWITGTEIVVEGNLLVATSGTLMPPGPE